MWEITLFPPSRRKCVFSERDLAMMKLRMVVSSKKKGKERNPITSQREEMENKSNGSYKGHTDLSCDGK